MRGLLMRVAGGGYVVGVGMLMRGEKEKRLG